MCSFVNIPLLNSKNINYSLWNYPIEVGDLAKGALKWILYIISAGLLVLGGLFLMASYPPNESRLPVGLVFVVVSVVLLYFSREKKPIEITQTVNVSGPIRMKELHCPNCGANLNAEKTIVIDGRPFIKCDYCGNNFEVTEEPTW